MKFGMINHEIEKANVTDEISCPYAEGCLAGGAGCRYVSTLPEEQIIMVRTFFWFIFLYTLHNFN